MLAHSLFVSGKPFQIFGQPFGAIADAGSPLPAGAVVAFDTPDACPEGWSPFAEAQSRAIVGATFGTGFVTGLSVDEGGEPLSEYKYRGHDGWEEVTLTKAQMPSHTHIYGRFKYLLSIDGNYISVGRDLSRSTDKAPNLRNAGEIPLNGDSLPHPNMPPYIALYFCKKD
jgi:hypothetical protein